MGLFGLFKKTPTVRCAQCGVQIKETDAHRYRDKVYCTICYSHQDLSFGDPSGNDKSKTNITIDIPNLNAQKNAAKKEADAMPASIQDVKNAFKDAGIHCLSVQFGDQWEVHAGVTGKDTNYTIKFICKTTDKNVLGLRIFDLIRTPGEKREALMELLFQLQSRYRFWRFNLDSNNRVDVEYDFPPATACHGKMAVELFLRTVKMIDDIYPELSKTVS